ncbi:methyl-accepting chemotaxis protein [Haloplanus pelagicus]|jgi:methyl-accepting chemotaxis protein|uniref:methyl-accepting chemotaxis protein n=1 Tax=Haloplanus pelagicus TaxID=2949995 RepID=UPI002041878A|nr:methyl-accepting chemotaxis protein [Haloplanus sp. HW8-1]
MAGASAVGAGLWQRTRREYLEYIPTGEEIPEATWRARHRNIVRLLVAHVPFLFALGRFTGTEPYVTGATFTAEPLEYVLFGVGLLVGIGLLARWSRLGRRVRTALAAVGLMMASAEVVYFSGGFIEAHFHFFVMVAVVAVYEDWVPFLVGILYVAIQHGVFGMMNPAAVYNHTAAIQNPWGWAFVHAVYVLALSAALIQNWISIERSREETARQIENVEESEGLIEDLQEKQAEIEEAKAEAEARQQEVERLNRTLLEQADDVAAAMDAVADGDFTAEPPTEADIEAIAEISEAFEAMTGELSATIRDLREFATTVEGTTKSVYDETERLEASQEELAGDVHEFATSLREQAAELESTTDELSTLSATIEEIAANSSEVSAEASNAADAAETGTATAAEAIEAIEHVEGTVEELASLVESLDGRMDDVAESTDLIEEIAEQTNILALNANIEAAHATTDGAGFAVVADEVKSLASETRDHSAAIEDAIDKTVEDVDRVQAEMEQTKAQIETGKTTMNEASDAFTALTETVEGVDASVDEVAAATDDGARTTEEVVDAIQRLADRSRAIAERSESLADRAEEGATTVTDIRAQLDGLTEQTASLKTRLNTFTCEDERNATEAGAAEEASPSR